MGFLGNGFFDSSWLFVMIAAMAIGGLAQLYIKRTFSKWSQVGTVSGLSGAQVATKLLQNNSIAATTGQATSKGAVGVASVAGKLTDHYDPRTGMIALSEDVYGSTSIAAVAVAAHETGHAIQDAQHYSWMQLRSTLAPVVQFGSSFAGILIIMGLVIQFSGLFWLGIIAYASAVLFQIVTLPVEINASRRALVQLENAQILTSSELPAARQVLTSAAFTYLAAALISLMYLLYYIGLRRD